MRSYRVRHVTTYRYDDLVTDSLGVAHLVPRSLPGQRVGDYEVVVRPEPSDRAEDVDYHGNHVTYFQVTEPHVRLVVEGGGRVDVEEPSWPDDVLGVGWHGLRPLAHPGDDGAWEATEFALASPLIDQDAARDYAAASLVPGRPVGDAVTDLMHRIHAEFAYDPSVTTVTSTVADTVRRRAGVCQDFAHLLVGGLRSHGLAARYVSGYLSTEPPPGRERVVGADASHAWVEVWLGGDRWLGLDPTNDHWTGDRYVTVAWGRDYGDVPPLKGVIFSDAERQTLQVSVDVAPVDAPVDEVAHRA